MNLPTESQCLDLFEQYKVPKNILGHCRKVKEVAIFLAEELKFNGWEINLDFVKALALLHDLFKIATVNELGSSKFHQYNFSPEEVKAWKELRQKFAGKYEGEIAFEILKDKYPELALSLKKVSSPKEELNNEELLVHYADLRIFQEKIVSLPDRFEYLMEQYQKPREEWEQFFDRMKEQERRIFVGLDFLPRQLEKAMQGNYGDEE